MSQLSRVMCPVCKNAILIPVYLEHSGSPSICYENPNEQLGEGVILIEKGEYKGKVCNNVIALYRKFNK